MPGKSSILTRFSTLAGSILAFFLLAGVAGALIAASCIPAVVVLKAGTDTASNMLSNPTEDLKLASLGQRTTIYGKDGNKDVVLATFFSQNRIVLKWDQIPKTVINATLAAEDIRYFQHGGVDPQSLGRAILSNRSGSGSGGSTIAMQYVKNVCVQNAELLSNQKAVTAAYQKCIDRSYARKLSDIRGAIALSKKYSKQDILLAYLNLVGFGGRVYGIEAAARYYYGIHASELNPQQAASLMAIVNNPEKLRLDQKANLAQNKIRRDYILATEYKHNMLTKSEYDKAKDSKITPDIHQPSIGCMTKKLTGFFCDYVVNTLLTDPVFGKTADDRYRNLQTSGWKVYTTIDLKLQKSAQATLSRYVPKTSGALNLGGAANSIQVGTGRILAMVQNRTYNNTAKAPKGETSVNYNAGYNSTGFQPGSTYKLFTLLSWIQHGYSINDIVNGNSRPMPASLFNKCGERYYGETWTYGNDEVGEGGPMSVVKATAGSVNGAFASMAAQLDLCQIKQLAQKFGVEATDGGTLKDVPPSVIGGASAVAPIMMTGAYAGVADNGNFCKPIAIDSVIMSNGKKHAVPSADCKQVISAATAKKAKVALHAVITSGTANGDQTPDKAMIWAKTGTTDNAVSTWMMGTTPKVATGVWVGNVSGHVSLRQVYSTPYCGLKNSSQAAIERHCIWRGIQTEANKLYGY